jgi:hypothetical protein
MNSQYDSDFPSQSGSGWLSIEALGVLNLLPDIRRAASAGIGFADACCVVGKVPREEVAAMLPWGLQLDRAWQGDTKRWPLAVIFARQRDVRPGLAPPLGGLRYNEFIVIVPSVFHKGRQTFQGPFCYMPTILLDSRLPLFIGAGFYGLKKRSAQIKAYHDSFHIRSNEGTISSRFENDGLPGLIQDFPQLTSIRLVLEQVIIGETSSGSWVYSHIDHNLDAAEFQPIRGEIKIQGKTKIEGKRDFEFKGIAHAAEKPDDYQWEPVGFRFLTDWALTYPIVLGQYETPPRRRSVNAFASAMSERVRSTLPGARKLPTR